MSCPAFSHSTCCFTWRFSISRVYRMEISKTAYYVLVWLYDLDSSYLSIYKLVGLSIFPFIFGIFWSLSFYFATDNSCCNIIQSNFTYASRACNTLSFQIFLKFRHNRVKSLRIFNFEEKVFTIFVSKIEGMMN